jgi:hypothetical protein
MPIRSRSFPAITLALGAVTGSSTCASYVNGTGLQSIICLAGISLWIRYPVVYCIATQC